MFFSISQAESSPVFSKMHKRDDSFKIKKVLLKSYSHEDWQRVSEFISTPHKENTGNRCVMRTDKLKRAGTYFIATLSKPVNQLPEGSKIRIDIIKDTTFKIHTYEMTVPAVRPNLTSELYCGITDQNIIPNRILCWKIEILDKDGNVLMDKESYMWRENKIKEESILTSQDKNLLNMERSLIILKPDCMEKNLAGEVIKRFNDANLKIVACKMIQLNDALLSDHYSHLAHLPFFPEIVEFMSSCPVIVMVLEGENAIGNIRNLLGPTDSKAAAKGTIRGDLGTDKMRNICHASDSTEAATAEIKRFFTGNEVF